MAVLAIASLLVSARPHSAKFASPKPSTSATRTEPRNTPFVLAYRYRLGTPPPGLTVRVRTAADDSQIVMYRFANDPQSEAAWVYVYAPGRFRPPSGGKPTTVHGQSAVQVAVRSPVVPSPKKLVQMSPAVVWQYAPGSYAVAIGLTAATQTLAAERRIAESVSPTVHPVTMRLPFRLRTVPARTSCTDIDVDSPDPTYWLTRRGGYEVSCWYGGSSVDIYVTPGTNKFTGPGSFTLDGQPAQRQGSILRADRAGYTVQIRSGGPTLTKDQSIAIVRTLELSADPNRPDTWFDASTLLP